MILNVAMKGLVINSQGEVLVVREAKTYDITTNLGKYTLPGGRIEIGEQHLEGLKREMMEEVGLDVEPLYPIATGEWRPNLKGIDTQIIAIFYVCEAKDTEVTLSPEHDQFLWLDSRKSQDLGDLLVDEKVLEKYFQQSVSR